jgi:two-component system, sensor histidine kinase RegB
MDRGKTVVLEVAPPGGDADRRQPTIMRRPEIIHGLRNLIQNAVDFAHSTVEVEATWTDTTITVRIEDDGNGFPPSVIGRIGDPFMRRRRSGEDRSKRPGYEGMGLGLFIAKTLLERTGARLSFANGGGARRSGDTPSGGGGGAIVVVEWPQVRLIPASDGASEALGDNVPILP